MVLAASALFAGLEFTGVELVMERVEMANEKKAALMREMPALGCKLSLVAFVEEYVVPTQLRLTCLIRAALSCWLNGRDLCRFDLSRFTHVFVFGAVFTESMLDRIYGKLRDPRSLWRSIALCVRQRHHPPIIAGTKPITKLGQVTLHKQSGNSFTFYIYRR